MSESTVSVRVAAVACATALLLAAVTPASAAVKNVYNWPQLWSAFVSRAPGDEIILHPGVYNATNGLYMSNCAGLTMRGSTGNAADVILRGPGMNTYPGGGVYEAFQFVSPDMTLADLTIEGFYHHAVHFQPQADRCTVDNVVTLNIGTQHMKGAVNNDDLIIRNCKLYQTESRLERPSHPVSPWNYIGGIDLHGARRAQIHDNLVMDIIGGQDGGDGGIFLWNASQDCVIERNVVIGCSKGIELGNPSDQGLWQVQNSIVRNNFILSRPNEDIGLELCYTLNVEVYNNTIYRTGSPWSADWGRTVHIYDNAAHPTTNLTIENNIIRGAVLDNSTGMWSSAALAAMGNIVDTAGTFVLPEWFVDPDNLNLHLTELAIGAIDMATLLAAVPEDIDGGPRPVGAFPDMGADEYGSPAGDADYDGLVDGLDYTIWSNNYGLSGTWSDANFNGDILVDGLDYVIWSNNYGFGYPPSPGGAVPEPGTLSLLALASVALLRRRSLRV